MYNDVVCYHSKFVCYSAARTGNIPEFFDAFWWGMTTMTTVGYGDFYPVTIEGRIFAIFLYIVGIGILGVVIGKVVDSFGHYRRLKGEGKYKGRNHIVIVGWSKKSEYTLKEILTTKDCEVSLLLTSYHRNRLCMIEYITLPVMQQ
ncbi:potassium channel family protein [Bacillus manliponensis]|uniref:potassium channel family protein n=1 Tax=Bacillus manliponensis TaxID=574376 RepID=UPI0022369D79|nr:potassium channel family protein [Bacillus manliponensis]